MKKTRRQRMAHTAAKQAHRGGKHRPKKDAKTWRDARVGSLTKAQVLLAYAEYESRETPTINALGRKYWQAWGYGTDKACISALHKGFRKHELPILTKRGRQSDTDGDDWSGRRAPRRAVSHRFSPRARAKEEVRRQDELRAALQGNDLLAEMVAEQEKERRLGGRYGQTGLSLDALRFNDGRDGLCDLLVAGEDGVAFVYSPRRRGQVPLEAPWVPFVLEQVDFWREMEAA